MLLSPLPCRLHPPGAIWQSDDDSRVCALRFESELTMLTPLRAGVANPKMDNPRLRHTTRPRVLQTL